MNFEGFPQPQQPEERTEEQLHEEALIMLDWAKHSFEIWKALENDQEPYLPTNSEEAKSYIEKMDYLKSHNQEKYRDKDGVEFYKRIDAYIEKLKEVK